MSQTSSANNYDGDIISLFFKPRRVRIKLMYPVLTKQMLKFGIRKKLIKIPIKPKPKSKCTLNNNNSLLNLGTIGYMSPVLNKK